MRGEELYPKREAHKVERAQHQHRAAQGVHEGIAKGISGWHYGRVCGKRWMAMASSQRGCPRSGTKYAREQRAKGTR